MLLTETNGHVTDRSIAGTLRNTPTGTEISKGDPKAKKWVLAQLPGEIPPFPQIAKRILPLISL